ncbi:MAG: hypothetical protein US12_C0041G0008 [Parcubacteria group bacterium GW2011_GWA2_36_24]|nr:MAG: hypothetical protein US12_C0041G0008 [Parcubacteria group bacterium GW2011_GWA2_36_24]
MENKKGFVVPLLIAIVAVLVIGGGVYVYNNKKVEAPDIIDTGTQQTLSSNILRMVINLVQLIVMILLLLDYLNFRRVLVKMFQLMIQNIYLISDFLC